MELGLNLGYWGAGNDADNIALAQEADRLGYSVAWAAEAYGSDTPTVLAWVGALTERIGLGAAVMQIPARTPAMTAMTAATLDTLSGGRFRLGLGVSGPQVSEGWHGVPLRGPARAHPRVRRHRPDGAAARDGRLRRAGTGPCRCPDGPGKALRLTVHPVRERLPIYLAAVGPRNLAAGRRDRRRVAGDLLQPRVLRRPARIASPPAPPGPAAARRRTPLAGFDIVPTVPVVLDDDVAAAAEPLRHYAALYVGGMGSREKNFYNALAVRMGFEEAAAEVQDLYLARRHRDAAAAVPLELIDQTALIGPRATDP